jgi:hypothetical protein
MFSAWTPFATDGIYQLTNEGTPQQMVVSHRVIFAL